jgi:hypothetical protein
MDVRDGDRSRVHQGTRRKRLVDPCPSWWPTAWAATGSNRAAHVRAAETVEDETNRQRERVLARLCCLADCVTLNHQLGRPSRALVDYIA